MLKKLTKCGIAMALLALVLTGCPTNGDTEINGDLGDGDAVIVEGVYINMDGSPAPSTINLWVQAAAGRPGAVTLVAGVRPAGADAGVSWASSNDAVATVVGGTVTAVGSGTATVTVAAGGRTAGVNVRVHAPPGPTVAGPGSAYAGGLLILQAAGRGTGDGDVGRTFVELFNRTAAPIDLRGFSLQLAAGVGDWYVVELEGTVPAGGSFLVAGTPGTSPYLSRLYIPDDEADMLVNFALSNRAFRVALMEGLNPLTVPNPSDMAAAEADMRGLMPAAGVASDAAMGATAAGLVDLIGVVNSRTAAGDVIHGAKGAPAYRISNQTSVRRTGLDNATNNNFNDFRGIDWSPRQGAVADDQIPVFRPRNIAAGEWTPTFPEPNREPTLPPPPSPPYGTFAAWSYTVAESVVNTGNWPATSGTFIEGTNLEFFYANGNRANLGRNQVDRAAVNVPNNAAGWFRGARPASGTRVDVTVEESAGWVITLNTTGYENIAFSAYQSSSNNGPTDFRLAYRIGNSGTWNVFYGTGTVTELGDGPAFLMGQTFDSVPLPPTVANQAVVQVRVWIATNAQRSNGAYNLDPAGGNTSLNHIFFTGDEI